MSNPRPRIYLDIDGTLIHEDLTVNFGKPAAGLAEFIVALRPYEVFWLTTHCRDGDPSRAQALVKRHVPHTLYKDIGRIQPTTWDVMKTEGIDWNQEHFIWFDDTIFDAERARFARALPTQTFLEVDLRTNPNQLIEITRDVFTP